MAIAVTTDLTMISNCDTKTASPPGSPGIWSAGTVDEDAKVEGVACLYVKYTSAGAKEVTYTPTTNLVLTVGTRIYFWVSWASKSMPNTKANSGLSMQLYTDATHWSEWKIAGNDTLPHNGWICHILDTSTTPDSTDGVNGVTLSNIDIIYLKFNLLVKGNVSWDVLRYGTTMTITGGDPATPAVFGDMLTADNNNGYGFISLAEGVYYLQGAFQIGTTTASTPTYFKDTSKIIAFTDKSLVSTAYTMTVVGNATGTDTTKVYFGTKSGTAGISGCVFKPAGAVKYIITATNEDIDDLGLYGCTFLDAGTISLPTASSTREVLNCSFENCAEVIPQTCKVQNCNFIAADNRGIRIASSSHQVSDSKFIDSTHCVHANFSTAVTFTNLVFSGSNGTTKWDIEHSAAGALAVTKSGTSNPVYVDETGGGSTTITGSVNVAVHVENESGTDIQGAQVYIQKASPTLYTADTGNTAGLGTLIVNEVVDTDTPQDGWVIVWDKSANQVMPYRYVSWAVKTFTFRTEVIGTTTSAGTNTILYNTSADFGGTTDVAEGDTIRNTTDGSWAVIDEIVSTTQLLTSELQGGTNNTWGNANNYSVHKLAVTLIDGDDTVNIPIANIQTNATGDILKTYTGAATTIVVRIRSNQGANKYLPYRTTGNISSSGYTLTAVLMKDEVAA